MDNQGLLRDSGRSERIRTSDPLVPNEVRYRTALRSDIGLVGPARNYNDRGCAVNALGHKYFGHKKTGATRSAGEDHTRVQIKGVPTGLNHSNRCRLRIAGCDHQLL